jgi:hypothetical protein
MEDPVQVTEEEEGQEPEPKPAPTPTPDGGDDGAAKARKQAAKYRVSARDAKAALAEAKAELEELKSGKKVSEQERALKEAQAQIEAANQRASVILQVAPLAQAEHVPPHWVMEDIDEEGIDGTDPQALRDVVKESAARFREEMAPFLPDMAAKAGYVKAGEAPASSQEAPPSQEQGEQGQPPVEQVPRVTLDVTGAPPANASTQEQMVGELAEAFDNLRSKLHGEAGELKEAKKNWKDVQRSVRSRPGGFEADQKFAQSFH